MLSSNAVRQRGRDHSPKLNSHQPSASLAIKSDSGDSNANANGKLHGRFRRRRDELLRSNKNLLVMAGALFVMALCLVGMWASSTSIDGGRSTRQIDQNQKAHPSYHKKSKKKGPDLKRPRGIGRRQDKEFFPIPKEKMHERAIDLDEEHHEEEEVHETRNKDRHRSPKNNAGRVESDGRGKSKRNKKSKKNDDDEDRSNVEATQEQSDDEKGERVPSSDSRPINIVDKTAWGDQSRPRVIRLHFEEISSDKRRSGDEDKDTREDGPKFNHKNLLLTQVHRLPTHESEDMPSSDRYVSPYPDDDEYLDRVENVKKSKKYRKQEREALEDKECKPRHEWQKGAYPNCNILHEFELGQLSGMFGRALRKKLIKKEGDGGELVKYLAHGYWRDVWLVSKASRSFDPSSENDEEVTVLKTLRYKHDFTDRNYDRHRKDALASERLSNSPSVVDIFAYCSNSAIFEYGSGGDIEGKLWPYDDKEDKYYVADVPSSEKLDIAYQVAVGIADMHDVEDDGYASIAHTDITPSQFIFIKDRWKLNDFNRCRFMRVYKEDNSPCGFYVGANPGKFRAPEEYEFQEENEMIDIYSMGNIFYAILSGEMPFEGKKESKAQKKVIEGVRPEIPNEVLESEDIAIQTLLSATKKCWEQKPLDRPSAASIRDELKEVMDRIKKENVTK